MLGCPPIRVNFNATSIKLGGQDLGALYQSKLSGTCPAGQMLRAIALDGTVSCQPLYSAGAGLALNATTNTLSLMACATGKVLKSNGTDWVCSDDAGSQPPVSG